jgi:diguanylate cyclase (GGDEF)-like protein/PAS domain S-box-containing protein
METTNDHNSACHDRPQSTPNIASDCLICILDSNGNISEWTTEAELAIGHTAGEILGQRLSSFYTHESIVHGEPERDLLTAREVGRHESDGWRIRKDGSYFRARIVIESISNDNGSTSFAVTFKKNVSGFIHGQKQSASKLSRKLEIALAATPVGMALFDSTETLIFANDKFSLLLGIPADAGTPGIALRDMMKAGDASATLYRDFCARRATGITREMRLVAGGIERILAIKEEFLPEGGWVVTLEDVSARKSTELLLDQMAHYDALTAIPNRAMFLEHLKHAIGQAERGGQFALLSIDLDHFSSINDMLGYPIGDELLKAVARRLNMCIRESDTIARMGGDDFAILQSRITGPKDAEVLATRVAGALGEPYDLRGHEVLTRVNIGITLAPKDGQDVDTLLKNADLALQRARATRPVSHCFFDQIVDKELAAKRMLEHDLRHALHRNELELFFQPLIELTAGRVVGYEALLRWNHPVHGMISPSEFIPAAEESGLIVPIGEWVLERAVRAAALWPSKLKVAVNVSAAQLRTGEFPQIIRKTLALSGMAPDCLEIEITESALLQNREIALETLHNLHELGVQIALDDFGTGFSSISYLRDFPFDRIKIDRSFIQGIPDDKHANVLVNAIAAMARGFRIAVTAEGVETLGQLSYLQSIGCMEAQGYLFGQATPAKMLTHRYLPRPWHRTHP